MVYCSRNSIFSGLFPNEIKNYETVTRLGREIIAHKDLVRRSAPEHLTQEFQKQELRIQSLVSKITN